MTELSPDARDLLREARAAFSPPAERLAAVHSALRAQIAASPATSASISYPASGVATRAVATAGWGGHTIGTAVLIGALGAGGAAAWLASSRSSAAPTVRIDAPALVQPTPAAVSSPATESALLLDEPSSLPIPTWQASPADFAPSTTSSGVPRERARGGGRPRSKAETAREMASKPPSADSLAEEVNLLRSARVALDRGDGAQALRLLDAHETRFQRGTLYEERLASRVLALCAVGRIDAARSTAQELERAAPRSPHLPRVRTSCIAQPANK
jgi:hypothetical protein